MAGTEIKLARTTSGRRWAGSSGWNSRTRLVRLCRAPGRIPKLRQGLRPAWGKRGGSERLPRSRQLTKHLHEALAFTLHSFKVSIMEKNKPKTRREIQKRSQWKTFHRQKTLAHAAPQMKLPSPACRLMPGATFRRATVHGVHSSQEHLQHAFCMRTEHFRANTLRCIPWPRTTLQSQSVQACILNNDTMSQTAAVRHRRLPA